MTTANTAKRRSWAWLAGGLLALACGDSSGDGDGSTGVASTGTTMGTTGPSTPDPDSTTGSSTLPGTTIDPPGTESSSSDSSSGPIDPPEGEFWVFVTADQRVSTWSMDPASGALTFERELMIGASVGPLAVHPDLSTLYVGVNGNNEARAYAIDPVTAELSPQGQVDLGWTPVYLAIDRSGGYLMSASFGNDEMVIFPLGNDGSLGGPELQRIGTNEEPHSILVDQSNAWVLVPHRTPDVVAQYAFDAATGTVSPNGMPEVDANPGAGPRHLVFHPDGHYAYVSDEFSDSVSTYAFDGATGQLTLLDTVDTLPGDFNGDDNTCADVHVTPDGRFVYVSNRGHDSLAMFEVDPDTGLLTSLGQVATEPRPREFEVSPRGRYVYAAGQDSGMMASYTVDEATGMLTAGPVYEVGADPRWVLAIELPAR
ncbi:MAG: lactonase family protein [Myxococcota bacterium]